MLRKRKQIIFSLLTVLFLLMINVPNVFAAKPLELHIVVDEFSVGPIPETFIATGDAVVSGLVCGAGHVYDVLPIEYHGNQGGPFTTFKVLKHFDCTGGDYFEIEMNVKLEKSSGETTAQWKIVGGTGAYAQLKGVGSLIGMPGPEFGPIVTDYYDGKVH